MLLMKGVISIAAAISTLLPAALIAYHASERTEIRVRLINALSGKPFAGRDQQLFGTNTPSGLPRRDILFHLQTKTGADGVAYFFINPPLPYRLLPESAQIGGCAWHGAPPIITDQVLKLGYVGPNECARRNQKFHWQDVRAQPGEIIIFAVEPRGP
jgi:hypothetical protein